MNERCSAKKTTTSPPSSRRGGSIGIASSERTPASRRHSSPKRSSSSSDEAESTRPLARCGRERLRGRRHAVCEGGRELVGKPVRGRQLEPARSRHEHGRERAAERLVGRLRDRVERRRLREMLGQRRGDPVEAALDPRLAHALLEARGVADRERGEAGERLEQVRLELAESPLRIARGDAEHAASLSRPASSAPRSRSEALVGPVRAPARRTARSTAARRGELEARRAPGRARGRPRSGGPSGRSRTGSSRPRPHRGAWSPRRRAAAAPSRAGARSSRPGRP